MNENDAFAVFVAATICKLAAVIAAALILWGVVPASERVLTAWIDAAYRVEVAQ